MNQRDHYGLLSALTGAISVPVIAFSARLQASSDPHAGVVLRWFDRIGLVVAPHAGATPEFKAPSLFPFTDESVIFAIQCFGVYLASIAVALAIWAEFRRERTLYLSIGVAASASALVQLNFAWGVAPVLVGSIPIFWLRGVRRVQPPRQSGA